MSQRHLTVEQRDQLWSACTEAYNEHSDRSVAFIRRQVRKKLAGFGWEQILIALAAKIITNLILKWWENRHKVAPTSPHPGFASEPLLMKPDPSLEE